MTLTRKFFVLGGLLSMSLVAQAAGTAVQQIRARRAGRLAPKAQAMIDDHDYLGFRVFLRKNFSKISHPEEWLDLRNIIFQNADYVGHDLVYAWDRRPPGQYVTSGEMNINESRFQADNLMMAGRFEQAFEVYQRIAQSLKKIRQNRIADRAQVRAIDLLYPYIIHSMARALYGAGRYDESFIVLRWIHQTYPKFRQVQFEKMWAAFRGGRIDHALGAVASQNSAYFSHYLSPESYLVQTYLYKRLCREEDFQQVLEDMRRFKKRIQNGTYTLKDWTDSDIETRVLYNLTQADAGDDTEFVSKAEREQERARIQQILERAFAAQKARMNDDLDKAQAYVQLAVRAGSTAGALKPIEKLPDRQTLFKMDLEIWPADSAEQFIDEVGTERFVGESLCGVKQG